MCHQLLLELLEGMLTGTHFGGAVGRQQQKLCSLAAASQRCDQIQGGQVGPVQILEDKDQSFLRSHGFDAIAYLVQQALAPRSRSHGQRVVALERSELSKPAWGLALDHMQMLPALGWRAE